MIPRLARLAGTALVAATAVSCAGAEFFPDPVPGARSITDWIPQQAVHPGRPGEPLSLDEAAALLRQQAELTFPGAIVNVGSDDDGENATVWLRSVMPADGHPLRGLDQRFTLESQGAGWIVVGEEWRYHCATEEATIDFCQ